MRDLNKFKKRVIDQLSKHRVNDRLDLSEVFLNSLPTDLPDWCILISPTLTPAIWCHPNNIDSIESLLSERMMDFVDLIDELCDLGYISNYPIPKSKDLIIGKKVERREYMGFPLSDTLTTTDLEAMFLKYYYRTSGKLLNLKKYNYKSREEFQMDKSLLYLEIGVLATFLTALLTLVPLFFHRC